MELRNYISIVISNLWLIIPMTLVAVTLTAVLTFQQIPIYEASTSYVTRTAIASEESAFIWGLDTLLSRPRIFITYCHVFSSQVVMESAFNLLSTPPPLEQRGLYEVYCTVMPESNVLLLRVLGPSPTLVMQLTNAITIIGVDRVNDLFEGFVVEQLDRIHLEETPVSPNVQMNLILGLATGFAISLAMAFMQEYLRSPQEQIERMSISNTRFNVYNHRYFTRRLAEEITRSKVRYRPLSLAMCQITSNEDFLLIPQDNQDALIRRAILRIRENLREGDIIAHYREQNFSILLPETPLDEARRIMLTINDNFRNHTIIDEEYQTNFVITSGLVSSSGDTMEAANMLSETEEALKKAVKTGGYRLVAKDTTPRPFILDDDDGEIPSFMEDEPTPISQNDGAFFDKISNDHENNSAFTPPPIRAFNLDDSDDEGDTQLETASVSESEDVIKDTDDERPKS